MNSHPQRTTPLRRFWRRYAKPRDWYVVHIVRRTPETVFYSVKGDGRGRRHYDVESAIFDGWQSTFATQLLSGNQVRLMTVKGATHPAVTYKIAGDEGSEGEEEAEGDEGSDGSAELDEDEGDEGSAEVQMGCKRCRFSPTGCSSCDPVKRAQAQAERVKTKAAAKTKAVKETMRSAAAHTKRMAAKNAVKK